MKTLAELRAECVTLGIPVETNGRASKEPYIAALRDHLWRQEHPDKPLPPQIIPMLLGSWNDLEPAKAEAIEQDQHAWAVQEKKDGVRILLHVERDGGRITGRNLSETTYRLTEHQANVLHLAKGLDRLTGTILDGELVCPVAEVNTGETVTAHPLQAAVAILATRPENARTIQDRHRAHLRFHAFDILAYRGREVTDLPLYGRLELLRQAVRTADNPNLELVPTFIVGKPSVHRRIIEAGGEGSVWKRLDSPYEPGRRVRHWLKRKATISVEAVVTGFKPGSTGRGHQHLVGAVEFGIAQLNRTVRPIAWVSAWSDSERRSMTQPDRAGFPQLNPAYLGRRALITGQDEVTRSRRLRHARIQHWLE